MPGRAPFVVASVALAATVLIPPRPAAADVLVRYEPPVDAPVIDPFRPPTSRYGPGNRGIEYATEPGDVVRAAGDGTVLFAGSVARTRHVTLGHADGVRTSYSFVDRIDVVVGQRVRRGQPIALAGVRLHLGLRDPAGTYLDPAALFDRALRARARLVPGADEGAAPLADRERTAFLRLVLERGLAVAGGAVVDSRVALHYAVQLRPDVRMASVLTRLARRVAQQQECTPAGPAPPPARGRVALLVGGLGSSSAQAAVDEVDTVALGYEPGDVVRFSYAGGLVPDPADAGAFATLPRHAYDAVASGGDLEEAASRLEQVLSALAAARPGVPIDVFAHSQGGLVARLAIATRHAQGRLPREVATLATLGTPHEGADLATAAAGGGLPDAARAVAAMAAFDPSAPAVRQLGELSAFVDRVRASPLPDRLHRVSIAARGDLVVPVPRTMDRELPTAVVPLLGPHAHDELPGSPDTTSELALAIRGLPPSCAPVSDLVADTVVGEAVSWATDAAGAALLAP